MISFADMTAMAQGDVGFVGGGTFEDNMPRMSFTEAADAFNVWLSETNCELYQQEQERDDALFEAACYAMNNGGDTAMLESAMMLNEASGSIMDKIKETWKKIKDWFSNLFQKLKMFISSFSKDNVGFWAKYKKDVEKSTKRVNRKGYDIRKFKDLTSFGNAGLSTSVAGGKTSATVIISAAITGLLGKSVGINTLKDNEAEAKSFIDKVKELDDDALNEKIYGSSDKDQMDQTKQLLGEKDEFTISSADAGVIGEILTQSSALTVALKAYQSGIKDAQDNIRMIESGFKTDDMKSDCVSAVQKYTQLYNKLAGKLNKKINGQIKAFKILVSEAKAWARAIVTGKHDEDAKASDNIDNAGAPTQTNLADDTSAVNASYSPLGDDFEFDW